jgi:hypothetical protein
MNNKPILVRLFTLFLLLEPILKILILTIQTDFSPFFIAHRTLSLGPLSFFNFWFLFPLAGLLLFKLNQYTFLAFIILQIYSIIFHLNYEAYTWPYLSELPHASSVALLAVNIIFTLYILLPRTRALFFDENLRWWERGSRFSINRPCFISIKGTEQKAHLDNISYSGALISTSKELENGLEVEVSFDILDEPFTTKAQVVRLVYSSKTHFGHGIQFQFNSKITAIKLRLLLFKAENLGLLHKYR